MQLTPRDWFASALTAASALACVVWWSGVGSQGAVAVRVVTGIVLGFGFAASASAVVPGFGALLHGSRPYLAGTSLLGLGALGAGVAALVTGSRAMLGLLLAATLVLWAVSTVRHTIAARSGQLPARAGSPAPR